MAGDTKELQEAPASLLRFEGAPYDIGADVWQRMCMPAVAVFSQAGGLPLAQLYSGLVAGLLGSMYADFGQERAVDLVRRLVDSFEQADLGGSSEVH